MQEKVANNKSRISKKWEIKKVKIRKSRKSEKVGEKNKNQKNLTIKKSKK